MNYRTVKKSKLSLLTASLFKDITHNKIFKSSLNLSKYLVKFWSLISNSLSNNSEYIYDKNTFYSKSSDHKCTIENPVDIQLISSRRTFL